jgi:uncharacterized protein (DUF849 family)
MPRKCIINCAVTGAIHVPSQTPHLPITPEQIAKEAIAAGEAGAATVHLHARVPTTGQPTMDIGLFQEFCRNIKSESDAVICITTGGAPTMTLEERMTAVKKFKPELASINMGSFNFGMFPIKDRVKDFIHDWEEPYLENSKDLVFKNTFYDQERIFAIMEENGTKPELECYDIGHLYNTAYWADKGILKPPFWIQLILGITGAIQPSVDNLLFMKNTADKLFGDDYIWSVLAAGRNEFPLGTLGAIMGGNVRVGLEDNIYLNKGELAQTNADMVSKMKRILEELNIETATPAEARQLLGLKGSAMTDF